MRFIMNKYVSGCLMALSLGAASVSAQNIEQVYLKNGSVYEGYIAEQIPGKQLSVSTEKATIYVDEGDIAEIACASKAVAKLPSRLREWALERYDSTQMVELATVSLKGNKTLRNAVMLEKGSRLKLFSCTKDFFTLDWADVLKTTKTVNSDDAGRGVRDVVTLHDGQRYEGQVVEQVIGSELCIRLEDGSVRVVKLADVKSIASERIDYSVSLWEQVPLLDRIEVEGEGSVEGYIVSRILQKQLSIVSRDYDSERIVPIDRVVKYHKFVNPDYKEPVCEKPEPELKEQNPEFDYTAVYLNGRKTVLNKVLKMPERRKTFYLVKEPVADTVALADSVCIEMPTTAYCSDFRVVRTMQNRVGISEKHQLWAGIYPIYRDADIAAANVPYDAEKIDGGRVRMRIYFTRPGVYVILPLNKDSECVAIRVK